MSDKVKWTDNNKEEAIEMLTKYFEKHGTGEAIYQSDDAQVEGLELVSEIADQVLGRKGRGDDEES